MQPELNNLMLNNGSPLNYETLADSGWQRVNDRLKDLN